VEVERLLRLVRAQRLQAVAPGGDLVLADDHREARSALVRPAHLRLEPRGRRTDRDRDPGDPVAQRLGDGETRTPRRVPGADDEHVRTHGRRFGLVETHQLDDPLDAERPADGRRLAPAELRDEPVVPPSGADRALRAEPVRDPLEYRPRVVIEPAHEPRLDLELDAGIAEQRLQPFEMLPRPVVEIFGDDRRILDEFLHFLILAIENAHRIALEAPAAVRVELLLASREIADQDLLVRGAGLRRADRVQKQLRVPDAELAPQPRREQDQLRIDLGLLVAERL